MIADPFQLDLFARQLVKIGVRLQAAALIIAEHTGTPTLLELVETTEQEARTLDRFKTEFAPQRSLPWP